jgi:hypothetical protein
MREARMKRREAGLMTVNEVAALLGLSRPAVLEIFTVIAVGARKFIRAAEVERWKARNQGGRAA